MSNYDNNLKGAMWPRTSKNGVNYFSGEIMINGQKYFLKAFVNKKFVKGGNLPYYNLVAELPQDKNIPQQNTEAVNKTFNDPYANQPNNDDQIPF